MKDMRKKVLFVVLLLCISFSNMYAQKLSDEDRETIEQRVIEKINDFISYLPEIAGKSDRPREEKLLAQKYINKTLELFIGKGDNYEYFDQAGNRRWHEGVKMQTTSRGIPNRPQPMKRYLPRLMNLSYQKVEIDTCSAVRIDKHIYEAGDGRYTATATFIQSFKGWRDGKLIINDKDAKQVTVYVERTIIDTPEGRDVFWIIRLGDVRITTDWGEHT